MPASRSPALTSTSLARLGSYLGMLAGVVLIGFALGMIFGGSDMPIPFQLAVFLAGALELIVCGLTLRRNRAAWAFALSLNGTLAAIFLFGAPKLRAAFDIVLLIGLLPTGGFALITTLLAMGTEDFG